MLLAACRSIASCSVWLRRSEGTVTPEESLALRLSPGTPVYRFHRLRFADNAPMAIEIEAVVASALPSLKVVDTSPYRGDTCDFVAELNAAT